MLWYTKFGPIIRVKREFRREYGVRPPDDQSIRRKYEQIRDSGSVEKQSSGRPRGSDEDVDRVRQAFIRSPKKSISRASTELQMR
jgi:hypothetical protein